MTDKKSEKSQDDRARPSPVLTTPPGKRSTGQGTANAAARRVKNERARSGLVPVALVLALVALGASGAIWLQYRGLQSELQTAYNNLASRVASSTAAANQAGKEVQGISGEVTAQGQRIQALSAELEAATVIIRDLDEALRNMTDRGSELVLLNDIDHLVTIAQQQLELGGNVRNAIIAMESAQAQLARANRPSMASLLQTMNGDLDRLRAASTIDISAFSRQLEELAMLLTDAPLIVPDDVPTGVAGGESAQDPATRSGNEQPSPTVPPAATQGEWWERAWDSSLEWSRDALNSLKQDLGRFIDVRRVDDPNALLMSPDQAVRFRENLRTRIMTAQLALMMRQSEVWKTETEAIVRAIESRYDEASPLTRKALRIARNMADASIDEPLPTVHNTLQALNALREAQQREFGASGIEDATPMDNGAAQNKEESQSSEPGPEPGTTTEPSGALEEPASQAAEVPADEAVEEQTEEPAVEPADASVVEQAAEPAGKPATEPSTEPTDEPLDASPSEPTSESQALNGQPDKSGMTSPGNPAGPGALDSGTSGDGGIDRGAGKAGDAEASPSETSGG